MLDPAMAQRLLEMIADRGAELEALRTVFEASQRMEYCCPECAARLGKTWPEDYEPR